MTEHVRPTNRRLALILALDTFTRAVWSGTPRAWSGGPVARGLCLQGLANGHFDALPRLWHKAGFMSPRICSKSFGPNGKSGGTIRKTTSSSCKRKVAR